MVKGLEEEQSRGQRRWSQSRNEIVGGGGWRWVLVFRTVVGLEVQEAESSEAGVEAWGG